MVALGDTGAAGPSTAMTDGANHIDWGFGGKFCVRIGSLIQVLLTLLCIGPGVIDTPSRNTVSWEADRKRWLQHW